ncbi:MAG: DnaA regulatory inactivator Hda [Rhodoferax sp.]|nr:DnaA regulatory inactivator Hda [Rhodoferax sp.]
MQQIALDIGLSAGPSFANFCVGANRAALEHLEQLAQTVARGESVVPSYLWGPTGCGKSHLLHAVGAALQAQGARVGWLDAASTSESQFNDSWAAVLMDDVHLYTDRLQHTAFSWFVFAQTCQTPVVAAGDLVPARLALRDDLRTRLGWGQVFGLLPLSEVERRSVLRQAADARGLFLGDEVMDFMLTRFSRDLRSLMELLHSLDAYALQTRRAITIPLLKSMMENT